MLPRIVLASLALSCGSPSSEAPPYRAPQLEPLPDARVDVARCLVGVGEGAPPPSRLSETGCLDSIVPFRPTPELVPFAVSSPLFSDDTEKHRWLAVTPGMRATFREDGSMELPVGSVIAKLFAQPTDPSIPLELRFSVRSEEAPGFVFFSYRFDPDGQDARLLDAQETTDFTLPDGRDVAYVFPGPGTCSTCHAQLGTLGPTVEQLAIPVRYGRDEQEQLEALEALGVVGPALTFDVMPNPFDRDAPLEKRARAYLHANCAHCHRPGGFAPPGLDLDLRWSTPTEDTRTICVPTQFEATAGDGMRIDPAYPDDSVIVRRMRATSGEFPGPMPPVARAIVDERGAALIREWAASLDASLCP